MKKKYSATITGKHIFLLTSPILIAWILVCCFVLYSPVLKFVNGNHTVFFVAYGDQASGGHSEASAKLKDNAVLFQYQLKEGYAWPFAGICFIPDAGFMNKVKGENSISLRLQAQKTKVVPIILNEYIPGYSDTLHNTNLRSWNYTLKIEPGKTEYKISLADFEVPVHWEKENQATGNKFPDFNPQRIRNICIQNCTLLGLNKTEEIRIYSMDIEKDYATWSLGVLVFSICWVFAVAIYIIIKRKKTAVFIPYLATETTKNNPDEWIIVQAFISAHYMEELDMDLMEKKLGIARHKIAALIKENTSLLFKQYLNQIRVAEAKRLLLKTDLPIGELADRVGFGHISNFNRVFKEYTGQSPSDLRKDINTKL